MQRDQDAGPRKVHRVELGIGASNSPHLPHSLSLPEASSARSGRFVNQTRAQRQIWSCLPDRLPAAAGNGGASSAGETLRLTYLLIGAML